MSKTSSSSQLPQPRAVGSSLFFLAPEVQRSLLAVSPTSLALFTFRCVVRLRAALPWLFALNLLSFRSPDLSCSPGCRQLRHCVHAGPMDPDRPVHDAHPCVFTLLHILRCHSTQPCHGSPTRPVYWWQCGRVKRLTGCWRLGPPASSGTRVVDVFTDGISREWLPGHGFYGALVSRPTQPKLAGVPADAWVVCLFHLHLLQVSLASVQLRCQRALQ